MLRNCQYLWIGVSQATSRSVDSPGSARGHPGFGVAAASTDLLRRVSGLVFLHDVGDIIGGQEALRAGW